jgi:hypothetical protein
VDGLVRRGRVHRFRSGLDGWGDYGVVVAVTARWRETDRPDDGASCALTTLLVLAFPAVLLLYRAVEWVVV